MNITVAGDGALTCHRCTDQLYLTVTLPHTGWLIGDGGTVKGKRIETLCPTCDADKPAAGPLLVFFTVHEQVTEDNVEQFGGLLRTWLLDVSPADIDAEALNDAVNAWRTETS